MANNKEQAKEQEIRIEDKEQKEEQEEPQEWTEATATTAVEEAQHAPKSRTLAQGHL